MTASDRSDVAGSDAPSNPASDLHRSESAADEVDTSNLHTGSPASLASETASNGGTALHDAETLTEGEPAAIAEQKQDALQKQISEVAPPYSVFSRKKTWLIVFMVSTAGFFSPLNSNSYFPSIPVIASDLGRTVEDINLTVTVYLVFQGISPSFWGSLADVYGRRPIYLATLSLYALSNIGLALVDVSFLMT